MEIKNKIRDLHFPDCPIRNVIARIGDRWSILILLTLEPAEKPIRFKEIQHAIPDISQKMLSRTLRDLEADGFVVRKQYDEMPVRVEYSLSKKAKSLIPILLELKKWGEENL